MHVRSLSADRLNERDKVVTSAGVDRIDFDILGRRFTTWADSNAAVKLDQYYSDGGAVAFFSVADGVIHFEHGEGVGTERMRTDNAGNVQSTYTSLPFGEPNLASGSDLDPMHFAGLDLDGTAGLGLHHATFREYNSTLGRWMSPDPYAGSYDPSNPQSFNRYSYAKNNPLARTDPSGLDDDDANDCGDDYDNSGSAGNGGSSSSSNPLPPHTCIADCGSTAPPDPTPTPSPAPPPPGLDTWQGSYTPPSQSNFPSPIVAPNTGAPKSQATCIAHALKANVPGLQTVTPTPGGPTSIRGGHENDTFNLSFSSPAAMAQFFSTTSRKSLIPSSVSEYGYGPGQRLSGGLHAEFYDFQNGQLAVTSHLDLFNPNDGLGPLLGHLFFDLIRGHIGHPNLDKGC